MSSFRKNSTSCSEDDGEQLRRGPWTLEEDSLLIHSIARHGEGRWNLLAKSSGLRRTGKSCRLRWLNYLKPDVKRGNLTPQEQFLILDLHSKWGNRWSKIAQHLPGRTDNEIKNYWRTRVQKQARHLKIDANSTAFQNVIRCFWMPRLLQKMQLSSSFSQSLHQTSQYQQQVVAGQGPCNLSEGVVVQLQSHQHQQVQNSDSDHSATSSSESTNNISKIYQFAEYQTTPFGINECNTLAKDCYDMETINQLASPSSALGDFENPVVDCHMSDNSWVIDGFADGLWSMGELWEPNNLN
ncbi:hypothetical protein PTKIN_Ptkin04bG0111500 [Pterospermum kingtungense]